MNDAIDACSDSDVSSNSSWTVLDDNASTSPSKTNSVVEDVSVAITSSDIFPELEIIEQDALTDDASELVNDSDATAAVPPLQDDKNDEDLMQYGCLTLEEYVQERELVHDYDFDETRGNFKELVAQQPKQEKRKRKKCKSEQLGIMVIVGTVLAVAGVSLLCLLTPNTVTLSNKDIEKVRTECGAEGFNKINASSAAIPVVLPKNNNKLNLVDSKGVLKKYFKANSTALQKVTDSIIDDKCAKNSKPDVLLKDDANDQCRETPLTGPRTYKEYMKQREQLLEEFKRGGKNKKCLQEISTKTKSKKSWTPPTSAGKSEILPLSESPRINAITTLTNSTNVTAILPDPQMQIRRSKIIDKDEKVIYLPATSSAQINKTVTNPTSEAKPNCVPPKLTKIPTCVVSTRFNQTNPQKFQNKNIEAKGNKGLSPQDIRNQGENTIEIEKMGITDHRKAACDILQDIMLLRMTSKVAKRLGKKCAKKEKSQKIKKPQVCKNSATELQESIKPILSTQPSIKYINDTKRLLIRKYTKNASNKTLRLLDELPFSQRKPNSGEESQDGECATDKHPEAMRSLSKQSSDENCQNRGCKSLSTLNPSQEEGRTNSTINTRLMAKMLFVEEVEKHHRDRLQYLRLARERQQKSVKSFIKDRRTEMEKYKDVGCGKYQVPIPSAAEVSKRLLELSNKEKSNHSASFTFQGNQGNQATCYRMYRLNRKKVPEAPNGCDCPGTDLIGTYKDSRLGKQEIGHLKLPDLKAYQSPKVCPKQTECIKCSSHKDNVHLKIPQEYIDMKKKYFERVSNYWKKREEYLEQRMEFMRKVSCSVQEIMSNYRNSKKNTHSETGTNQQAITKIITEAVAAFPDDSVIQNLRPKGISTEASTSNISDKASEPSTSKCSSSTEGSSFEFTANQSQLVCRKSANVKDNAFYTWMFGKKGHQIRKRDLSLWYLNKMAKKKKSNEASKYTSKLGSKHKKHKKDIVGN